VCKSAVLFRKDAAAAIVASARKHHAERGDAGGQRLFQQFAALSDQLIRLCHHNTSERQEKTCAAWPYPTHTLTIRFPARSHHDLPAAAQAQDDPGPCSGSLSSAGTCLVALPGTPPACAVRPPASAPDQRPAACRPAGPQIAAPPQPTAAAARGTVACLLSCHLGSGAARAHASHASQAAWHPSRAPRAGAQQELLHAARLQRAGAHDAGGRDGADHGRPHPGAAGQRSAPPHILCFTFFSI